MITTVVILLAGFQLKHYVADYLLQPGWMVAGKGSLGAAGGYAHAGIHAVASAAILWAVGVPAWMLFSLAGAEFVIHFLLDFWKMHYSKGVEEPRHPARYWALFGFDQLMHQATYLAMIYFALSVLYPGPI